MWELLVQEVLHACCSHLSLFWIKVANVKNFEVNNNTKHPYNHVLPDCEIGFHFWVRQLRFQFWAKPKSGNCGRFQFWACPKVETADAFPVLGLHKEKFTFWLKSVDYQSCSLIKINHSRDVYLLHYLRNSGTSYHCSRIWSTFKRDLTLSHLGGGADSAPPGRLSLITPKQHKVSKWIFSSLISHIWGSFCTQWQFSLISGVAMATFCYGCVAE